MLYDEPPNEYEFSATDFEKYRRRFWGCPVRLVNEGTWASFWRDTGTRRGGGAVSSVLPVLAVHTWPEKRNGEPGWTPWTYLSQRRIARLAGINKDTVKAALERLVQLGFAETRRQSREKHQGGREVHFRLSCHLYAHPGEAFARVSAGLIYGGVWSVIPSPASRHLYITLACLDPIKDEAAYLQKVEHDSYGHAPWWEQYPEVWDEPDDADYLDERVLQSRFLEEQRMKSPLSLADLATASGLPRRTVISALNPLLVSLGPAERGKRNSLICRGIRGGRPTWYALNPVALGYCVPPSVMNDSSRLAAARRQLAGQETEPNDSGGSR